MSLDFAPDAQYALMMATMEAERLNHDWIGTEHLLLGLLREQGNQATVTLNRLGVAPSSLRQRIHSMVVKVPDGPGSAEPVLELPYTHRCVVVFKEAMREANRLDHGSATTGDLLVGLLLERKGIAAQILGEAGVQLEAIRIALSTVDFAA